MSAAGESAHHDHEEHIHLPEPAIWPLILAIGIPFIPAGTVILVNADPTSSAFFGWSWQVIAYPMMLIGAVISLIGGFGWAGMVIREKPTIDANWGNRTLSFAWKLFLISEAAIFFAFFWHYGYMMYKLDSWPPAGTPPIHLTIPAIGTLILFSSSLTCELGHKAMIAGRKTLCKNWLFLTFLLGVTFLGLQAFEWGYLRSYYNFTVESGVLGTSFYLITGFHGAHVITGLLLLALAYSRIELGDMDRRRHFSLNAASWYWHFVDVIWVFVFLFVYVGLQGH
jgi:cytochrome c oxidase subunit 3